MTFRRSTGAARSPGEPLLTGLHGDHTIL
jgi:hypothetical protein